MRYEFEITGVAPLLMHNDNLDWSDRLRAWQSDPKNKNVSVKGDDRSPAWSWIGSLYHDQRHVVLPADNLATALRQAGSRIPMKGNKTFKETAVSAVWIEHEFLAFTNGGRGIPVDILPGLERELSFPAHLAAVRKLGFDLFCRRAKIGQAKHVRVRPIFREWSAAGTLDVRDDAKEITADILGDLFREAGRIGVGDWRPGCKTPGRYGMFEATKLRRV